MAEFFRGEQVRLAINVLRLVLMPVACLVALFVTFIIGLILRGIAQEVFCPANQQVSGLCIAPWWHPLERCIIGFSVGLSAVLVVVTAFFVNPIARVKMTWLVFSIGAILAIFSGIKTDLWAESFCAVLAGLLTTLRLLGKHGQARSVSVQS